MPMNDDRFQDDQLKSLDDLDNYEVADGEPDPRGWEVCSGSTKIGEVDDLIVDTGSMKVRYLDVDLEDEALGDLRDRGSEHVSIPVERVQLDYERRQVILSSGVRPTDLLSNDEYRSRKTVTDRARTAPLSSDRDRDFDLRGRADDDESSSRLTRSEEEAEFRKDRVQSGEVVVGKHVETEHVETPVTREREEVEIERRPVAGHRADEGLIGSDKEEVRIPISEEQVTVEKRPVVKEELVINKRTVEETDTVGTDVRKERFDVEERDTGRRRDRE